MRRSFQLAATLLAWSLASQAAQPAIEWQDRRLIGIETTSRLGEGVAMASPLGYCLNLYLYGAGGAVTVPPPLCPTGEDVQATAVAADAAGRLFTVATQGHRVNGWDAPGSLVIRRHDSQSGLPQWAATLGYESNAIRVAVDSNGDLALTTAGGTVAGTLRKFSGVDGTIKWAINLSWAPIQVKTGSAGTILIAGRDGSTGRIHKYANDGTLIWSAAFPGALSGQFPNDIAVDAEGNVYAGGGFEESQPFARDFLVAKLRATDGAVVWRRAFAVPTGDNVARAVAVTPDGRMSATGISGRSMATVGYTQDGQIAWTSAYPASPYGVTDEGLFATTIPGGDVVVAGLLQRGTPAGDRWQEVRVERFKPDGTKVWSVPYRPSSTESAFPRALVPVSTGVIFAASGAGLTTLKFGLGTQEANHQGLWWRSPAGSQPGWGLNLAQQGDTMFAAWFTYRSDGQPHWWFMPALRNYSLDSWTGEAFSATGPDFSLATFDPKQVKTALGGYVELSFQGDRNGVFEWLYLDPPLRLPITPYAFGPATTCVSGPRSAATTNYQDMWWADPPGSESGWGLFIAHQGDGVFMTWFTYDGAGKATWFFGSSLTKRSGSKPTFAGALTRASGPAGVRPDPWPTVAAVDVGTASLEFDDASHGTFRYVVNGISGTKRITRTEFGAGATACQ